MTTLTELRSRAGYNNIMNVATEEASVGKDSVMSKCLASGTGVDEPLTHKPEELSHLIFRYFKNRAAAKS